MVGGDASIFVADGFADNPTVLWKLRLGGLESHRRFSTQMKRWKQCLMFFTMAANMNACASRLTYSKISQTNSVKPMTQESYFQDLHIKTYRPQTGSKKGFVFFHGFPGEGVRNEDLAEVISEQTGFTCFVVHFGGLGNGKGKFGFKRSIEQSLAYIDDLMAHEHFDSLSLYGHSWGGLVAINIASKIKSKIDKLILVSPYSMLPPKVMVRKILTGFVIDTPSLEPVFSIDEGVQDLDFIDHNFNPKKAILQTQLKPGSTLFLQAKEDEEVPAAISRAFLQSFPEPPEYHEVDQVHSFRKRDELIATVKNWLDKK